MSITVTGRKMPVTDALRMYAEEKIGNSMKVMDINPLDAEVVLHVEKNPANATPAICEVTLRTKGHIVRVEESEEDMYAAIDVAAAKVLRQLRKFKTRVLDRKVRADAAAPVGEFDPDSLMAEFTADEQTSREEPAAQKPNTQRASPFRQTRCSITEPIVLQYPNVVLPFPCFHLCSTYDSCVSAHLEPQSPRAVCATIPALLV